MYENNRQKALIYVTNICGYFKTEKKSWYTDASWLSETPDIKRNQGSPWWKRYVSIWNQRNIKTNCWFPNRRKRGSWCKKRLIHQTASRQSIGFDKGLRRYCWKIPTTIGISSNRYGYAKTYKSKNKSFKTRIKHWFPEMCIIEIIVS